MSGMSRTARTLGYSPRESTILTRIHRYSHCFSLKRVDIPAPDPHVIPYARAITVRNEQKWDHKRE